MNPPEKLLERLFDAYGRVSENLSLRWREHANRRTILILVLAGSFITVLYLYVIRPPDNFPLNTLVTIEGGTTLADAGVSLEQNGVVRSGAALRWLVVLTGHERDIHAGDYLFKEPRDLFGIARAVVIGAYGLEPARIRIPEGARTKDMAHIFGNQLLRFNVDAFLPQAQGVEGYLFPGHVFLPPERARRACHPHD